MEEGLVTKLGVLTAAVILFTYAKAEASSSLYPLILVPGIAGSPLEARLTEEYKPTSKSCGREFPPQKNEDGWFRLWFDINIVLPEYTECIADRMALNYDSAVDDFRNAPGVETRVPNFGSTKSLLYLNPQLKQMTEYMASLVNSLEEIGYVDGETLFGAPYDFRYGLAAKGHPSRVGSKFLRDLKHLIEEASSSNQGKPVILLSHSLGGLFLLQLLNRNTPSWRQRHIKHFLALATPWGGAVEEMLAFASGDTIGVPLVNPLALRRGERTYESNLWLLPAPKVFGRTKPLVVVTPDASNYTAYDIPNFLQGIGFPEGILPYQTRILPLVERLIAPEVPITCLFGTGVETQETLVYGEGGFDQQPEVVYGDGDGTVNLVSLLAIESEWANQDNQPLKFIRVPGVAHSSIISDEAAIGQIIGEISSINSELIRPHASI